MKIVVAQINPVLGDFSKNRQKTLDILDKISELEYQVDLVVFPECSIFGYHPVDLLERKKIVESQLKEISKLERQIPPNMKIIVGAITKNNKLRGKPFKNSALLLEKGKKQKVFSKELLPTYDVFDEARHLEPGRLAKNLIKINNKKVLITICEDIWGWDNLHGEKGSYYKNNPLKDIKPNQVDVVVNLSASPFSDVKWSQRMKVGKKVVQHFNSPLIYTNMVGAQDELVFDGFSFVMNEKGQILNRAKGFEEDLIYIDLLNKKNKPLKKNLDESSVGLKRKAIVMGLRDFITKSGFEKVHFGLSGGVDSALVACLACEAIGKENVTTIALPGPFNSPLSLELARKLSQNLGCEFKEIPIGGIYENILNAFTQSMGEFEFQLTNENIQARVRSLLLMAFSNFKNSLLLNTSNKSELAMGYSTLYGDLCGGISPIGDLLKSEVYELSNSYNESFVVIPEKIITRAPTAELRPNQKDRDTLPEYSELDDSVKRLVEQVRPVQSEIDKRVLRSLLGSEFKRWQAPPILRVSSHAFGRGRRLPIAHQYKF